MLDSLVFPPILCIHLDAMTLSDHGLLITGTTMSNDALCPLCQHASTQIHSQYGRTIADVPCLAQCVQISLTGSLPTTTKTTSRLRRPCMLDSRVDG